jgi:hypothetical protein
MKIKVQLVVCAEDGREEQVQEIAIVEKPYQRIEHLGFTLAEAKSILKTLQQHGPKLARLLCGARAGISPRR